MSERAVHHMLCLWTVEAYHIRRCTSKRYHAYHNPPWADFSALDISTAVGIVSVPKRFKSALETYGSVEALAPSWLYGAIELRKTPQGCVINTVVMYGIPYRVLAYS